MSKVTVKDNGAVALMKRVAELAKGATVRVGVLDDGPKDAAEGDKPSKLSLLEVAALHEFGAPGAGIPQRSFIRGTVDEQQADIFKLEAVLARQVLAGTITPEVALERLGAKVVGMVQTRMAEGIAPANAPSTIAAKGSSKPLVNTGQLRSSITYKVVT